MRFTVWNTNPTLRCRNSVRLAGDQSVMSTPPTSTRPLLGVRSAPAIEHSVVLPEPDGPMRATISRASTVRSRWSSAVMVVSPTS